VVGLIGPNGSGKTTLVSVISGFIKPSSGTVMWRGREITGLAAYRVARLGVVRTFQHAATFPRLGVRENLEIALEAAGRPKDGLDELLGTGESSHYGSLPKFLDQQAGELPFGIARLLGIAMAMARKPSLILLDEPAAGLNEQESELLGRAILAIAAGSTSVVMIDHDMAFLLPLCQRVVVLDAGTLIADGGPDEVRNDTRVIETYLGHGVAKG
jgi:branched-chain amino acid transport system ATP-binding protein